MYWDGNSPLGPLIHNTLDAVATGIAQYGALDAKAWTALLSNAAGMACWAMYVKRTAAPTSCNALRNATVPCRGRARRRDDQTVERP